MNETERLRNELQQRFPTIDSPRSVFVEPHPQRVRIVLHQIAAVWGWMITTRIIDGQLYVWRMK
jgi:hypothetical protein